MINPMPSRAPFDPDAIRDLAKILTETGLTEIEISDKDRRLRVVRAPTPAALAAPVTYALPAPAAPVAAPASPKPAEAADDPADDPGAVTSPMVGIAYLSPEPGLPPYVQPGQAVQAGQTVMLIEAMKTFNQIKAPRAGTVSRVLVSSGEPVEYGQPLLVIG
jgi:acetyl-CoA carboxylase biotin carboxyl carrier protein